MIDLSRPHAVRPDSPTVDVSEDRRRVLEAIGHWRRRSRLIRFFRKALPALIGALILIAVGLTAARTIMADLIISGARDQEVRMVNPRFFGQDSRGRGFTLGAAEAVQDRRRPSVIRLEQPTLSLNTGGTRSSNVSAQDGVYDQEARTVALEGDVVMTDEGSGYRFESPSALVDTAAGVISGSDGITGVGPTGSVNATSYAIYDSGARIVFRGSGDRKVTGVITPAPRR